MASVAHIAFGILASLVFWTILGLPIAERVAPRMGALYLAPSIGWCVYNALALPIFSLIGLSGPAILIVNVLLAICAVALLWGRRERSTRRSATAFETTALLGAIALAVVPMSAVLPKVFPDGIGLAWPIFDHAKIAMIDEMIRSGVPAINPFFVETGSADKLVYYYLWHFSAAVLGSAIGLNGWEADAALTWFTAFATLSMMIGFAVSLSGRASSACWVVVLAATGSIRPILDIVVGSDMTQALIGAQTGFGGWLFQSTWAPQHAASAMAVVLAIFLLTRLAEHPTLLTTAAFALVAAAGFQSSVWVGGVVFAMAAVAVAVLLAIALNARQRIRFAAAIAIAAALCLALVAPFIIDQMASAEARGQGFPLAIEPLWVFGAAFPHTLGTILNLPAYWVFYLPAELPGYYGAGAVALALALRGRWIDGDNVSLVRAFAALTVVGLCAGWLLVSVIGDNNDLGWRAILPSVLVLIVFAASGLAHWIGARSWVPCALIAGGFLFGLPDAIVLARDNYRGKAAGSAQAFVESESMWQAVRRSATPDERIANNPLFLSDMTPWPVNISWALLANRRSCYAGNELALPFAPVSTARRQQIDALFRRLFAGEATAEETAEIAGRFRCDLVVVTPQDGAWLHDPFAAGGVYGLVDERADGWRIYKRIRIPQS